MTARFYETRKQQQRGRFSAFLSHCIPGKNKSLSDKHPFQRGGIAAHCEQKNRRNHDSATLFLPFIYLRLNLMCVHACQLRH
nr:MAG TPA: hypothetical protein [Caudoviricetes sp.]